MSTRCTELYQQPVSCYFIFLVVWQSADGVRVDLNGEQSETLSGAEQYQGWDGAFSSGAAGIPTVVPAGNLRSLRAGLQRGKGDSERQRAYPLSLDLHVLTLQDLNDFSARDFMPIGCFLITGSSAPRKNCITEWHFILPVVVCCSVHPQPWVMGAFERQKVWNQLQMSMSFQLFFLQVSVRTVYLLSDHYTAFPPEISKCRGFVEFPVFRRELCCIKLILLVTQRQIKDF